MLTLHFFKLVKIVRLRVYLDFALDESYTPTRMEFWGGWSSDYGLVQFAEWTGEQPRGWQEISLEGCGVQGRAEVRCMVLQVRVIENHQNGKDTHVRGLQVFSLDERVNRGRGPAAGEEGTVLSAEAGPERIVGASETRRQREIIVEPEWMGELELR